MRLQALLALVLLIAVFLFSAFFAVNKNYRPSAKIFQQKKAFNPKFPIYVFAARIQAMRNAIIYCHSDG